MAPLICLIALLALLSGVTGADAPPPSVQWSRTFGGHYGDGAWAIALDDSGFIFVGHTSTRGEGADLWIVKADSWGFEEWNRTLGGSGEDAAYTIARVPDGGYIIAGSTGSFGLGGERLWLLRLGPDGSLLWDRTYGGFASSSGDGGLSVAAAADGGFVACGYTSSEGAGRKDLWLVRTGADGSLIWKKAFGGEGDDVGNAVIQTKDGGFLAVGRTSSFGAGGNDIWLLKTDSSGREEWNATIGGEGDDAGFGLIEVGGGYVIAGRSESPDGEKLAVLVKANVFGNRVWERDIIRGGSAIAVCSSSDGGFILAGHVDGDGRDVGRDEGKDAWVAKVDSEGAVVWETTFGGPGDDVATSVVQAAGGYVVAGITDSTGSGAEDAWLVKIGPEVGSEIVPDVPSPTANFIPRPSASATVQAVDPTAGPVAAPSPQSPAIHDGSRPGWTGPVFPRFNT